MKYYLFNHAKSRQYAMIAGDLVALFLSVIVSYSLRIIINNNGEFSSALLLEKFRPWLLLVVLPHLICLYLLGCYALHRVMDRFRSSLLVVVSVLLAGVFIGAIFFFFPRYLFGRQVLLIHLVVASCFLVTWRLLLFSISGIHARPKRVAIICSADDLARIVGELECMGQGLLSVQMAAIDKGAIGEDLQWSGRTFDDTAALLRTKAFDILVFDPVSRDLSEAETQQIIEMKYLGKAVFDLPSFFKNFAGRIPLDFVDGAWLLQQQGLQGSVSRPYAHMKRLLDFTLALIALLLTSPLFLATAIAVKLNSKGPAFFAQERLGLHRKPFNCLKFRTMVNDAEAATGPVWSSDNDPRITSVGRFLRKTRLDELPQLLNILTGDLSFVGPRPIRKHFADRLTGQIPYYDLRFSVVPGLSGWAQVNMDYAGSEEGQRMKFEFELFYIQNMSFFLDVLTIIKTIKSVFHGQGK